MGPQCHFCIKDSHGPCSWPVEDFAVITAAELQRGDIVRRFHEERSSSSVAMVTHVIRMPSENPIRIGVGLHIQPRHGLSRMKTFSATPDAQVKAKRKGTCGLWVCQQHIIIRGPGVYLCQQHWHAWEHAA